VHLYAQSNVQLFNQLRRDGYASVNLSEFGPFTNSSYSFLPADFRPRENLYPRTIPTPQKPSNCAWDYDDSRSLYITAGSSVYRIRVNTPGKIVV
jgi:hypothetical protein